jgi:molybdate transport system ATP-binding protein
MSADVLDLSFRLRRADFQLELSQTLALSGVTALFGPSGSGKTSLLRVIAGFERPESGHVRCGDQVWHDHDAGVHVPPHRRPVGYMFQDARLFAHLSVAGNLRYAARRRPGQARLDAERVHTVLELDALLERRVDGLSGGERQRVALGRTLLGAPRLLLLDEPLTALDQGRKEDILPYLERLPEEFGIPTLYVSHDVDEVAHLADRIVVLAGGRVRASGPTAEILERFDLAPYTGRFEAGVVLTGTVSGHDERLRLTRVDLGGTALSVPMAADAAIGDTLRLRIRARDVALATRPPEGLSIRNVLPGTLAAIEVDRDSGLAETLIDVSGTRIRARLTLAAVEDLALEEGLPVYALVKSVSLEGSAG